ncbi:DUF551 domain-containing protein [Escherichia coli]|uniref:DUF551 domain-containing protein n=1 Tax=Escherichia coli TaxID=562 RepID=UPI00191932ED|nr:DUF551 domain-containing protein [Escherichia coli]UMT23059.1 DUF551 domain-containing protein [Escherichia coli]CAD6136733.1 Eaa protein [Escherichia coli]
MPTITRESADLKSFITGFLSDSAHESKPSDSLLANVFRIALASLEAEPLVPVMYKGMKLLTKEGLELIRDGIAEATGLEAMCMAEALLSGASVPEEMYWLDAPVEGSSKAAAYATGWNACRAAMLQSGNFRDNKNSSTNNFREIPETSTNSPVIPDGWISCSERMPPARVAVLVCMDGIVQKNVYCWDGEAWNDWYKDYDEEPQDAFTHWMPLPEPPQEANR